MVQIAGRAPLLTARENRFHRARWNLLDLTALEWLSPFDVVVLATEYRRAVLRGAQPTTSIPVDPVMCAYAVAAGLPQHIEAGWPQDESVAVHPPLVPLQRIDEPDQWDDLLEELWPRVRAQLGDARTSRHMFDILGELVDNATTHGRSPAGVFVCAQIYTGETTSLGPSVWFAVADAGVGIPDHLRRNDQYASISADDELIGLARKPGVTGTADRRGYGLWETLEAAVAIGSGQILIRSGEGEARFWFGDERIQTAHYRLLSRPVPGTWIHGAVQP